MSSDTSKVCNLDLYLDRNAIVQGEAPGHRLMMHSIGQIDGADGTETTIFDLAAGDRLLLNIFDVGAEPLEWGQPNPGESVGVLGVSFRPADDTKPDTIPPPVSYHCYHAGPGHSPAFGRAMNGQDRYPRLSVGPLQGPEAPNPLPLPHKGRLLYTMMFVYTYDSDFKVFRVDPEMIVGAGRHN